MAGNLQTSEANTNTGSVTMDKITKQEGNEMGSLGILRDSIGRLFQCTCKTLQQGNTILKWIILTKPLIEFKSYHFLFLYVFEVVGI